MKRALVSEHHAESLDAPFSLTGPSPCYHQQHLAWITKPTSKNCLGGPKDISFQNTGLVPAVPGSLYQYSQALVLPSQFSAMQFLQDLSHCLKGEWEKKVRSTGWIHSVLLKHERSPTDFPFSVPLHAATEKYPSPQEPCCFVAKLFLAL